MIPGTLIEPSFALTRYRPHQVSGNLKSVIRHFTKPGEIVLELNTTGAAYVYEALQDNRRILAVNLNPISMLITHVALNRIDATQVRSALSRLGDSPKGQQPLISHIQQQYRTRCPHCAQEATAAWFAWDRDTQQPFRKLVHCANCGTDREGAADESDALSKNLNESSGLAFHVALERAVANNESIRPRIAELVSLYTARNLSVLMDVIHRLPTASQSPDIRRILTAFVIEALDFGSSLSPYGNVETRPKSLRPPRLFLEYNVWDIIEKAMLAYTVLPQVQPVPQAPATSLTTFLDSTHGYILIANTLQSVVSRLPEGHIKLLIIHPDPQDIVYYALSSLWSTWLWKSENLPSSFRAFMGRRRIDQEWHQNYLSSTMQEISHVLHDEAGIYCPLNTNSLTALNDIINASRKSECEVIYWLNSVPEGYRLLFNRTPQTSTKQTLPSPPLQAFANTLILRGEPTSLDKLKGIYLIEEPNADLESLPSDLTSDFILLGDGDMVWLRNDQNTLNPLADRVEESTLQLLQQQESWVRDELEAEIYALYNGPQTPEPELVNICIDAYTVLDPNGFVSLRPEDTPKKRRIELQDSKTEIEQLGKQLGFTVERRVNGDIVWREPGKIPYLFRFTSTALLSPHLTHTSGAQISERRCLVLPGGRAALVALKLRRDPRLKLAISQNNWGFIKFRHLRHMLTEIKHRGEIDVYLGLDPIVEKDTAQIPLPLG